MAMMRNSLLAAALLLQGCDVTSATAGPVFGAFCPRFMENLGACNRNPTSYWMNDSCNATENPQLAVLTDFYFETGNRWESGPLFDKGWLVDCEYCEWEGVSCNEAGNITAIEVGDNSEALTGTIPTGIFSLGSLKSLEIYANEFTGTIPTEIFSLGSLESLEIYANEFSGNIPSELGLLSSLSNLKLHYNDFRSTMPEEVCDLGSYITADCAYRFPRPEVRCERITCCDACYSDVLRGSQAVDAEP